MRFVLIYEGPLPPNGGSKPNRTKHNIRKQLHPQLKRQWEIDPTLRAWLDGVLALGGLGGCEPDVPAPLISRQGFDFRPMVTKSLNLVCSLGITFMRPEEPGRVVMAGGDIDNRLKTLFDGLTVPNEQQVKGQLPEPEEKPFYCLLEDDGLITGFEVKTERLLKGSAGSRESDVQLIIEVLVRPSTVTNNNVRFLGGFL